MFDVTTAIYVCAALLVFWAGPLTGLLLSNSLFPVVAFVFAALKLSGIVEWSWWWVMLPLWGYPGGLIGRFWTIKQNAPIHIRMSLNALGFTIGAVVHSLLDTLRFAAVAVLGAAAWSLGEYSYDAHADYHISNWSIAGGIAMALIWTVWRSLRSAKSDNLRDASEIIPS